MWLIEWWQFMLSGFWVWLGSLILLMVIFGCPLLKLTFKK